MEEVTCHRSRKTVTEPQLEPGSLGFPQWHTMSHRTKELGGPAGGNVTQFDDGKVVA